MSTEGSETATTPLSGNGNNAVSRRNQVMVGDLPRDFLRCSEQRTQEEEDECIARILQAQQQAGVTSFASSNIAGRLSITIVQAILNKNYGITKMDPYCRVRIGHTVFETPTALNGIDSIYVEIFDERSFTVDDRVAWAVITIPPAVLNAGETVDEWYTLSGRLGDGMEGRVNIVMSLTPASSMSHMNYVTTYHTPVMMPMYFPQPVPVAGMPVVYPQQVPQQVPQQPQPPPFTEEDMKQVKDMFPNMEEEVIRSVLEANGGNKDATINSLLSMNAD
ncbi:hypothetical protein C0Q70_10857 [Pomacea canaliculata]|uniref:CUE domain-containing protein n=1 Tax=Pomacea canaliculata TaxID=400727 RepID=A0A2T7P4D1_POMCA|nr:hypothetical protein C0Q70_10857 [Pomacea canaliculata]